MQTFLPYPSLVESVRCLDRARLGKQRVEARQILATLRGASNAWAFHPAIKMWRGYEAALSLYGDLCIIEWIKRGYKNNMPVFAMKNVVLPTWIGNKTFHISHQSNLLRKFPEHYSQFGWNVPDYLPYVWPI